MDDPFSDDEEEVIKNFDDEAKLIIQSGTLPKKSSDRYLLVYDTYQSWKKVHNSSLSASEENNLLVYFKYLKESKKLKPSTIWSIWSMLKSTLNSHDNIEIKKFQRLNSVIANYSKGYKPKKSLVFRWDQIVQFMNEAPDLNYLAAKVILIFGLCGTLRCDEIVNMKVNHVENLGDKYLVSIITNKNEYPGQFIIGSLFYERVNQYISMRPPDNFSDRFFIHCHNGKCTRQPIGKHWISHVPFNIATFLNLENAKDYTGHCFRRTSATLLSESGANSQMIRQAGRWRSDLIAQGYIENSLRNRQMIYEGVVQQANTKQNLLSKIVILSDKASTSTSSVDLHQSKRAEARIAPRVSSTSTSLHHLQPTASSEISIDPPVSTIPVTHDVLGFNSNLLPPNDTNLHTADLENDNNYDLEWVDFADEIVLDEMAQNPGTENVSFVTANNKVLLTPPAVQKPAPALVEKSNLFSKPGVKVKFNQAAQSSQSVPAKKMKLDKVINEPRQQLGTDAKIGYDEKSSIIPKSNSSFEHCSFNNCTFNISSCKCN